MRYLKMRKYHKLKRPLGGRINVPYTLPKNSQVGVKLLMYGGTHNGVYQYPDNKITPPLVVCITPL